MCGSMVDIQSPTAEIRRGKKEEEERNHRAKIYALLHRTTIMRSNESRLFSLLIGRPFVKRLTLCYQTIVCPVLSVTLLYCRQTVGRIKMKLGMQVGLGQAKLC